MAIDPTMLRHLHGVLRGSGDRRRSRTFEGRFGRMFRNLPPADFAEQDLTDLAAQIIDPDPKPLPQTLADEDEPDINENPNIPAGYTYLGQFIDHDLTFDPVSSLERAGDPEALVDFRTPRFDLDSIYGRGPADQPYLYQDDGIRMLLGRQLVPPPDPSPLGRDIPRYLPPADDEVLPPDGQSQRAMIGDPRNDEHVILAQLHSVFLRFHNRVADRLRDANSAEPAFEEVQRLVRWHYQWVVLHDYLQRIVNPLTYAAILPQLGPDRDPLANRAKLHFYRPRNSAFMPIEFSAAAYRFAHSMVRPFYRLNRAVDENLPPAFRRGGPFPILATTVDAFGVTQPDFQGSLIGFREFNVAWVIEWQLFFEGVADNDAAAAPDRVQPSYLIDTVMVDPLKDLQSVFPRKIAELDEFPSLAHRDLIRGWQMQLPSGESVADAMGLTPSDDLRDLLQALANDFPGFEQNTPLWYYILAEAEAEHAGAHLGRVGGRIVMETFVGLMLEDGQSFLRQRPIWAPDDGPLADYVNAGEFGMAEFIRAATD